DRFRKRRGLVGLYAAECGGGAARGCRSVWHTGFRIRRGPEQHREGVSGRKVHEHGRRSAVARTFASAAEVVCAVATLIEAPVAEQAPLGRRAFNRPPRLRPRLSIESLEVPVPASS